MWHTFLQFNIGHPKNCQLSVTGKDVPDCSYGVFRPLLKRKFYFLATGICGLLLFLLGFPAVPAQAQMDPEDEPVLIGVFTPEEHAYIYHDQDVLPPLGHGFHVYREYQGEEVRLTEEPVFPASSGTDFRSLTGDLYPEIEAALEEASDAQEVFFHLRGNPFDRGLLAFTFPQVARALGMLYIDEDPVIGEAVRYRFEYVNQRGESTGHALSDELEIRPVDVQPPGITEIKRLGRDVSVRWEYPEPGGMDDDDIVIRFELYMRPETEDNFVRVTEESRLRLVDQTEFEYRFNVDPEIEAAEFTVEAIDITGKNRMIAEPIAVELLDEMQPNPVLEVYSTVVDGTVELTWPVSSDPGVAGYHVKRINAQTQDSTYLTTGLIDVSDPTFTDRTLEPGYHYHYFIIAESETGVRSELGNPAIENIIAVNYPDAPSGLQATINEEDRVIELGWQGIDHDTLFNTYVVLRRSYTGGDKGAFSQVNDGRLTDTTLVDDGVAAEGFEEGMFYEYGVTAANRQGLRSDTIFVVKQMPLLTPPEPPASVRASIDDGNRVQLNWGASSSTTVTNYHVYKITEEADTTVTERSRGRRYLQDDDVTMGRVYRYHVTAVDSVGNESEPAYAEEVVMRDRTPPPSIRNVQAVETDDGVRITWEPSPARDLEGYVVKRATLANGVYDTLTDVLPDDNEEWVDPEGEAGLWYRVIAVDESGNRSRPGSARQARD